MIGSLTDGLLYWITPVATTVERLVIDVDREARPSIEQSFSKRGNVYQTNILKKSAILVAQTIQFLDFQENFELY